MELVKLGPPATMTKSLHSAMGCEYYFAHHHLVDPAPPFVPSELSRAGTEFHRYRSEYVEHLVNTNQRADRQWVDDWLDGYSEDEAAFDLIRHDRFEIEPTQVLATELFLSVNDQWEPREFKENHYEPGYRSAWASGMLDLVLMPEEFYAVIRDVKTGFSSNTVSDFEAAMYVALLTAHIPELERVRFEWEFPRFRCDPIAREFRRADFEWLRGVVRSAVNRAERICRDFHSGKPLSANPWAGLCAGCNLECPARDHEVDIPPVQNDQDATLVAAKAYLASIQAANARKALQEYLAERGGSLRLGKTFLAEIHQAISHSYPAKEVLAILGIDTDEWPADSERYGVPLGKLMVTSSSLSSYAKAKKRKGLTDELERVAKLAPRTELKIRRLDQGEQAELALAPKPQAVEAK